VGRPVDFLIRERLLGMARTYAWSHNGKVVYPQTRKGPWRATAPVDLAGAMSNRRNPGRPVRNPARQSFANDQNQLYGWVALAGLADLAEARGDAEAALDVILSNPVGPDGRVFWRPWRIERLAELTEYEELPQWAIARWVVAQSLQHLDGNSERMMRGLQEAILFRGGMEGLPGVDDIDARCKVMDHDWVFRQRFVYDHGGLQHFVRRGAQAGLLARAGDMSPWLQARMSGYNLVEQSACTQLWADLSDGSRHEVLNLGSPAPREIGDCVLGRVVQLEGLALFEGVPLSVPRQVADEVAGAPEEWVDLLADGVHRHGIGSGATRTESGRIQLLDLNLHGLTSDGQADRLGNIVIEVEPPVTR